MIKSNQQLRRTTWVRPVGLRRARAIFGVLAVLTVAGCTLDLTGDALVGQGNAPDSNQPRPAAVETVTVRFRNLAVNEAVDVQFHASAAPPGLLPDDLLVPENLVTASIGVAGTGIVQPLREDGIEYPCSAYLTLGTAGGRFSDNETGALRGSGTPRWVQEGPLALCGGIVTFVFAGNGTEFTTTVMLSR